MTIGEKQDTRYILPAHVMLEVVAAVGLAALARLVEQAVIESRKQTWRFAPSLFLVLGVGLQAAAALPYAPDYGVHRNHLLGGGRVAACWLELGASQWEGIEHVAAYLDSHAAAADVVGVEVMLIKSLDQYHVGRKALSSDETLNADYYVFSHHYVQRGLDTSQAWKAVREGFQNSQPQFVVRFDGVDYYRVYKAEPSESMATVTVERGGWSLVAVAWVWAAAQALLLVWSLRMVRGAPSVETAYGVAGLPPSEEAKRSRGLERDALLGGAYALAYALALALWFLQLLGALWMWRHIIQNSLLPSRRTAEFYALLAAYHAMMFVWGGWVVYLAPGWPPRLRAWLAALMRRLTAHPRLLGGSLAGLWGIMVAYLRAVATRPLSPVVRAAPPLTLALATFFLVGFAVYASRQGEVSKDFASPVDS